MPANRPRRMSSRRRPKIEQSTAIAREQIERAAAQLGEQIVNAHLAGRRSSRGGSPVKLMRRSSLNSSMCCAGFTSALLGLALSAVPAVPLHAQQPARQPSAGSANSGESFDARNCCSREAARGQGRERRVRHSAAVQKLGSFLGLNTEQAATAFTLFNFLVLAIGVGYVLLKTLPKTFRCPQLADSEAACRRAHRDRRGQRPPELGRSSPLEARRPDRRRCAHRPRPTPAKEEHRIRASVEDEKSKILAAAESEIQSATAAARRDIQQFAAGLAIEQAARKLVVTAETDRLLVESFARQLTGDNGGQN